MSSGGSFQSKDKDLTYIARALQSTQTGVLKKTGTDTWALDANLYSIGTVGTPGDGTFLVGNGSSWVGESGATALTSLGATTTGSNLLTLADPSAVTFPRINADNSVSALSAAAFCTAIGANASVAPLIVTHVSGTGTDDVAAWIAAGYQFVFVALFGGGGGGGRGSAGLSPLVVSPGAGGGGGNVIIAGPFLLSNLSSSVSWIVGASVAGTPRGDGSFNPGATVGIAGNATSWGDFITDIPTAGTNTSGTPTASPTGVNVGLSSASSSGGAASTASLSTEFLAPTGGGGGGIGVGWSSGATSKRFGVMSTLAGGAGGYPGSNGGSRVNSTTGLNNSGYPDWPPIGGQGGSGGGGVGQTLDGGTGGNGGYPGGGGGGGGKTGGEFKYSGAGGVGARGLISLLLL